VVDSMDIRFCFTAANFGSGLATLVINEEQLQADCVWHYRHYCTSLQTEN